MSDLITHTAGLTDPSFTLQDTRNYGLNLLFSETTFTFALIDLRSSKYLALHHLHKNEHGFKNSTALQPGFPGFLKAVLGAYPWLKGPFRSIHIGYEGQKATLIPATLFDASRIMDYLKLNFSITPQEVGAADHLPRFDTHLVYAIPAEVQEAMKEVFPLAKVVHHGSIFMQTVWLISRLRTVVPRVFIHLRDNAFDLMVYDGRQLLYFNTFTYIAPEDIVYFVLFAIEQLNHNPEKIQAILLGNVDRSSNLYELLFRYIKHVDFGRRNEGFRYAPALSELAPHGYYTLFNFQACGL